MYFKVFRDDPAKPTIYAEPLASGRLALGTALAQTPAFRVREQVIELTVEKPFAFN